MEELRINKNVSIYSVQSATITLSVYSIPFDDKKRQNSIMLITHNFK